MYYKEKKEHQYKKDTQKEKYYFVKEKTEPTKESKLPTFDELMEGLPVEGSILSSSDIHNGVVFFSSLDTHVYAVDAKSGEIIWKFKTGGQVVSTPLVHNDHVYFGSFDGHVYCLDLEGGLLWKKNTGDRVASSPTAVDNNIIIPNGAGFVFCFSNDGEKLWKFRTGGGILATPKFINDLILVGSYDKRLYALNINGKKQWTFAAGERIGSPLIMSKGNTIFSHAKRSWDSMPFEDDPWLYCGSYDNRLYCLDINGDVNWTFDAGSSVLGFVGGDNGAVYISTADGRVFSINAIDGRKKWDFLAGGMVFTGFEVSNRNVYFGSLDQRLYCFSQSGEKIWSFLTGGPVASCPLIFGDMLYFGSGDTFFYCLNTKKREVEWTFQVGFGSSSSLEAVVKNIVNAFIEHDRRIFKVWKPETVIQSGSLTTLQNYVGKKIPKDFDFSGIMSYTTKNPYISGKKYVSERGPYRK